MGREIRRVPPNWEHPKQTTTNPHTGKQAETYRLLYNQSAEEAWADWLEDYQKFVADESQCQEPYREFCSRDGLPPDPDFYRPRWAEEEQTWYQVYETISEGTPVSPPFPTEEDLIEYLVTQGDFSGKRWSRRSAELFVREDKWTPGMVSRGFAN